MTQKYIKRPTAVEAFRLGYDPAPEWFTIKTTSPDGSVRVKTLEGTMVCKRGDWIIRGVRGETYPCDHAIFMENYEAAP